VIAALGKTISKGIAMIWIEIETQISDYKVRTYRGLADKQKIEQLLSGNDQGFLQLNECYWYNDADDQSNDGKALGSYQQLGHKEYSNFTGSICIRCSTIINVSFLKGGFSNEPIIRGI